MKYNKLLGILICILILSACSGPKDIDNSGDSEVSTNMPAFSGKPKKTQEENLDKDESIPISLPDLTTEEGIRDYLVGQWFCNIEYMSNVVCKMDIGDDLNINISFHDSFLDENKGDYEGKIKLDRIYANSNEAPDMISIELNDEDYPKGDFFFLHRTVYDKKRVMSLFFADGKSVFNRLANMEPNEDDDEYMIEEVMFEKETGESSQILPRKDDWFYAVFWGQGIVSESLWIDDVWWTPEMDDSEVVYPRPMTVYEIDIPESVLYTIAPGKEFDILGEDIFKGLVYYVETDESGNIIEFIDAEYKDYLERESYSNASDEVENLVFDIFTSGIVEIEEYLDVGMDILFTGETTMIDGEECYYMFLGTNHEEVFSREIHYAVNIYTEQIYRYDILEDAWEELGMG